MFNISVWTLIVNDMVWTRGRAWGGRGRVSPNLATVSSVMTLPSLWKTILFCLHLHESSFFFLLFCSQRSHGTFANIFKSCEKQDFFFFFIFFFFKSSTSQVFLFKACSTMPSSSWLVLNAAGLWDWGGGAGGGGKEKGRKKKRLQKSY